MSDEQLEKQILYIMNENLYTLWMWKIVGTGEGQDWRTMIKFLGYQEFPKP